MPSWELFDEQSQDYQDRVLPPAVTASSVRPRMTCRHISVCWAMPLRGAAELFTREDSVEAQWQVVDGILGGVTPFYPYEPGTWGPDEAYQLIGKHGPWLNPRCRGASHDRDA